MLLVAGIAANAQSGSIGLTARLGYNIGAYAPLGIPATITSIDAFHLTPSPQVGVDIAIPLSDQWGVASGLRFENKAMDVAITAKGYHMVMSRGGEGLEGLFTGHVVQHSTGWMLSLPVYATFDPCPKLRLKAGPFASLLVKKEFSGIASDGYIREGGATGPKITIGSTSDTWATYDFSADMRGFQWGIAIGADWQVLPKIGIYLDMSMGLRGIFPADFTAVEQTLYPIYGTLGVFYRL